MALLAIVLLAQAGLAGQNPDLRVYLDFAPPNHVNTIEPELLSSFDVYFACDQFGPDGGLRVLEVGLDRTFGGQVTAHTMLYEGLQLGHVEDSYTGWVSTTPDCVFPDSSGLIVWGYVTYFYTGPPGELRIFRPEVGNGMGVDCNLEADFYCIGGNAGIWMSAPGGEPGCELDPTPAEAATWGAIKALYQ
jgi:hypothetical protein